MSLPSSLPHDLAVELNEAGWATNGVPARRNRMTQLVLPLDEFLDPNESSMPMSDYTHATFWKRAAERSIKTAAQTAVALIGAEVFNVLSFDWGQLASVSAGAAVLSVLTSIASGKIGEEGDPSLVG